MVSEISCGGNQANVTNTVDAKISFFFYEESDLPTSVQGYAPAGGAAILCMLTFGSVCHPLLHLLLKLHKTGYR